MGRPVLNYLPDETDVSEFQTSDQSFKLTSQRLLFDGESKRLFVLPGGRVLIAAMLRDVDVAFLGRQHLLPTWVGLIGAGIALSSLTISSMLGVLLGAIVVAAWYFLGGTVLEFRVKGRPMHIHACGVSPGGMLCAA